MCAQVMVGLYTSSIEIEYLFIMHFFLRNNDFEKQIIQK